MSRELSREDSSKQTDAQSHELASSNVGQRRPSGRPQSIPETHFVTLLRLRLRGMGYRTHRCRAFTSGSAYNGRIGIPVHPRIAAVRQAGAIKRRCQRIARTWRWAAMRERVG